MQMSILLRKSIVRLVKNSSASSLCKNVLIFLLLRSTEGGHKERARGKVWPDQGDYVLNAFRFASNIHLYLVTLLKGWRMEL